MEIWGFCLGIAIIMTFILLINFWGDDQKFDTKKKKAKDLCWTILAIFWFILIISVTIKTCIYKLSSRFPIG